MRLIFLLCVVVATAYGLETVEPARNYFEERGIPLAKQIKETEDEIIASQDFDKIRSYHYGRIVGGSIAPDNMYPYLAGLLLSLPNTDNVGVCGGSLISTNRVVTAAHCWNDGSREAIRVEVVLGSLMVFFGGTRLITWNVIVHEHYNPASFENDVAMIHLPNHITFVPRIQPVALPFGSLLQNNFAGWWASAAGFGRIKDGQAVQSDTQLSHVYLSVIDNSICTLSYTSQFIKSSTICTGGAGGVGICQGDSGGPLVVPHNGQYYLIGISSFTAQPGCALGHPSAYARVTSFNDWILQHMCPAWKKSQKRY